MIDDPLLDRARRVWRELAGALVTFPDHGAAVAVSPSSLLCPPGWVGIVALGEAAIVTVPADNVATAVREGLRGLPVTAVTDPDQLRAKLPIAEVLGPASLGYCDDGGFRPNHGAAVEVLPSDHADVARLLASVPVEEAEESGLAEITSQAFVVRRGTHLVAAAGYRRWPAQVAHMCVLTAPAQRGLRLGRVVASAAVADSLANQQLPQWRARLASSRRVARALGFRELGVQLSISVGV